MTFVEHWTGHQTRALRRAMRLSVRSFAEYLGVAPRTVAKWEALAGSITLRPDNQAILDTTLRRAGLEVELRFTHLLDQRTTTESSAQSRLNRREQNDENSTDGPSWSEPTQAEHETWPDFPRRAEIEDMDRRELLRLIGIAGAALGTPASSSTIAGPSAIGSRIEHRSAAISHELWHLYDVAQVKSAVLPLVRDQIDALTIGVAQAGNSNLRRRTSEELSELLQLAGEISFDADRYTDAAHCYALAATASQEAENYDLWACALIRHSFVALYEHRFAQALPMLEAAQRLADRGDHQLATRPWASAVTAHAHAGLGNLAECNRALDRAEAVHGLTTTSTGWLRFRGDRLPEERGTCLVQLHQYEQAEASLTEALQPEPSTRRVGSINVDLAIVGARLGDCDRVKFYADRALRTAAETRSGYVVRRLNSLKPHLGPLLRNKAVRRLNDQILHLTTAMTDRPRSYST